MNEKFRPVDKQEARLAVAVRMAQNPLDQLQLAKSKPNANAFSLLIECRGILRHQLVQQPTLRVAPVDSDFMAFYKSDNGHVTFYESAFRLLQRAGYSRNEAGEACVLFLRTEHAPGKEDMIKEIIDLVNQALISTYGPIGSKLH